MLSKRLVVLVVLFAVACMVATVWLAPRFVPGLRPVERRVRRALPSLAGLSAWRNGPMLTLDSLRGRPVALLLWSDTDPRAGAALQVVDGWHRAFAPLGLRVLAVHVPDFAAATDSGVASRLAARLGLALPMADDAGRAFMGALGGPADGPHLVVADAGGRVVVDTVGDLAAGQRALRALLPRGAGVPLPPEIDAALPPGARVVALGAGRVVAGPLAGLPVGTTMVFTAEFRYQEQGRPWTPFPVGGWRADADGVSATRGGAANFVAIRYSAGRAGVVATPPPGASARVWILRDDRWPLAGERDEDVVADAQGAASILVTEPRLYWIDRGDGERTLKLSPETPGVTLNAFVFTGAH
jgi:hypothetical protein